MEEDNKDVIVDDTSVDTENPTGEVEENEEIVGAFEDTSETGASDVEEEKKSEKEEIYTREELQKEIDRNVKGRLARVERDNAKKIREYEDLVRTLRLGMGKNDGNVKDLNKDLKSFYKEQGIDIPEQPEYYSEKEEIILGNHYADELIEADDDDEINRIATEIYQISPDKRSAKQRAIFNRLGEYMNHKNAIAQLKKEGIDTSIVDDDNFKKFASQFSANTPIKDIYNIYNKVNVKPEPKVEKKPPASMGSIKTIGSENEIKEYYTPEEVRKFTSKDLDNPALMKAVEKSMARWRK